jgi:two-component system repressor protein LuxO
MVSPFLGAKMTKNTKSKVLLVEDAAPMAQVYIEYLRKEPYTVTHAPDGKTALNCIKDKTPDAVLLDLKLPDMDGMDILQRLNDKYPEAAVVIITAHGSINTAVEAMQAGAVDFLVKPFAADRLVVTLRNALERTKLSRIVETYRRDFDKESFDGFIGSSLAMQAVYRTIESAAPSNAAVFVKGESGTGKELCAEAIHHHSRRREGPLVPLNCAAIPKDLMESEIFGHVKGAFTGATTDRKGAAELADGGTLFLDEICEMDMDLQAKLLWFIQSGQVQPVGSSEIKQVDVRFVCATNKSPFEEVSAGRFREDLYYRLHVIPLQLPPLRDREDDVVEIAESFLSAYAEEEGKDFKQFSDRARHKILGYDWPGNVRELQNAVRNAVVLNQGETIEAEMLILGEGGESTAAPIPVAESLSQEAPPTSTSGQGVVLRPFWQVEQEYIRAAMDACDDNVPRAAALLEISPSTVYRRLREMENGESLE